MSAVNSIESRNSTVEDDIGAVVIEGLNSQPSHSFQKRYSSFEEIFASVYLGEIIKFDVVVKRPSQSTSNVWKKHISRVTSQASIFPLVADTPTSKDGGDCTNVIIVETNETNGLLCPVLATFFGNSNSASCSEKDTSWKPYFRDDDTYVFPMSSHLLVVSGDCQYAELRVVLWLFKIDFVTTETSSDYDESMGRNHRSKRIIPVDVHQLFTSEDDDNDDSMNMSTNEDGKKQGHFSLSPARVSSSHQTVQEKTATVQLKVQGPPELQMRNFSAGQKQLILLAVRNKSDKQMMVKSIQILSSSTPVHDVGKVHDESPSIKWESCHQLINLECPKRSQAFPVILSPFEELNLIYRLYLSSVPSDSELSLRANVKWTHAGASSEITTVYKLPRIKIRCPPFIVTVKCEDTLELSKTFFVTYSISNQLHDFISMRLYYNLDNMSRNLQEYGGTEEEVKRIQHLKDSIVCHDPDTAISSCLQGSYVPIRVGFQIHKPGLYELSELMKVNLRYSLPETQLSPHQDDRESHSTSSDTSISFQSTDDHLLASEELWRGRGGSTASLSTPIMFQSAEERRRSFAAKSYSFGDLGPTVSAESEEGGGGGGNTWRKKVFQRSSAVAPPRPPPPRMLSQTERELIQPSNFLKQPFYIYMRDPLMLDQ